MGRIRKFTQEAYDALQSGVSDDGEILDFFSDIPLNISNFFNSLELEDDLSNFQSYLRDISDFENYTAKKIDDIFRDVINVDETYATIFRDFNDRMTDITNSGVNALSAPLMPSVPTTENGRSI